MSDTKDQAVDDTVQINARGTMIKVARRLLANSSMLMKERLDKGEKVIEMVESPDTVNNLVDYLYGLQYKDDQAFLDIMAKYKFFEKTFDPKVSNFVKECKDKFPDTDNFIISTKLSMGHFLDNFILSKFVDALMKEKKYYTKFYSVSADKTKEKSFYRNVSGKLTIASTESYAHVVRFVFLMDPSLAVDRMIQVAKSDKTAPYYNNYRDILNFIQPAVPLQTEPSKQPSNGGLLSYIFTEKKDKPKIKTYTRFDDGKNDEKLGKIVMDNKTQTDTPKSEKVVAEIYMCVNVRQYVEDVAEEIARRYNPSSYAIVEHKGKSYDNFTGVINYSILLRSTN